MAIEPRLNELKGNSRLALGFFNSLIRRIECTKPLGGNGIFMVEKPDGIQINLGSAGGLGLKTVDITICEGGTAKTIQVYAPE